jgi:hypothetical protein
MTYDWMLRIDFARGGTGESIDGYRHLKRRITIGNNDENRDRVSEIDIRVFFSFFDDDDWVSFFRFDNRVFFFGDDDGKDNDGGIDLPS